MASLDGRRFTESDRILAFREDREGAVTGSYSGGTVVTGTLAGRRDGRDLSFGFAQIERNGVVTVGRATARLEALDDGRLRIHESWTVPASGASGAAVLDELAVTRWVRTRVAHPTASVPAAIAFYGDLLGLPVDGPHPATPYELVFFALPGGGQLELTGGGESPVPSTGEDLLVLYVPTPDDVAGLRARLEAAGVRSERASNPYWEAMGVTVQDPDGRLVVIAALPN